MSRPLRLEFEGAFWPITSRGNERKDIFRQDGDRLEFLSVLAMAVKRFRCLPEYCLRSED
jgi:putative transposase